MKALLLTLGFLLMASAAFGQGLRTDGIAFNQAGRPQPGATVAVCTQPATTNVTPCSPLATLYTDSTLTVACNGSNGCANPLTADGLGNYHFYYSPINAPFTVQFSGAGVTTSFLSDQLMTGVPTIPTVYNVLNYGLVADSLTDNTAKWNALRSIVTTAQGGTIYFPAATGCYLFASSVNFTGLHAVNISGAGTQGVGGTGAGAVGSKLCSSAVLTTTPAYDFSGAQYIKVSDLQFDYSGAGAAPVTLYAQRTVANGFCEDVKLDHIAIARATGGSPNASFMVNNCEVIDVSSPYIDQGGIGFLATFSNTYSITSPFSTLSGSSSQTQVNFYGGKIVGSGINVQLDGGSGVISDTTFHGTFFANTGGGNTGFNILGTVWGPLVYGMRYECTLNCSTGTNSWLKAANGATIVNMDVHGLDSGGWGGTFYVMYSPTSAAANGSTLNGVSVYPINWAGSLMDFRANDGSGIISVTQTNGNIIQSSFKSNMGTSQTYGTAINTFTYTGALSADIDRYTNVTCIKNLGASSTTCPVNSSTEGAGEYVLTYSGDVCQGILSGNASNWTKLNYITGTGTITCPATSSITTITATFNGNGDWFVMQKAAAR